MMRKIVPTIFAKNKKQFKERLKKLIESKKDIQIDFMDGKFVKTRGIKINDVPNLSKYNQRFEAHLMTLNPSSYIKELKDKGFKKIIFHYESIKDRNKVLGLLLYIRTQGMKAVIALNPETDIEKIREIWDYADGVLFMGVHPGKENQKFIPKVYQKIRQLRKMNKKIKIQVDGGVNLKVAEKLRKIRVNILNTGSFISSSPIDSLKELDKVFT